MMEAAGIYLLRSAVWITGFAMVYLLFLRNEKFFLLNRIYLITGILASVFLPLVTVRYFAEIPAAQGDVTAGLLTGSVLKDGAGERILAISLVSVWLTGVLIILSRYVAQVIPVLRAAANADSASGYPVRVLRSPEFPGSFSLFSLVVVNPSVSDTETREIMNHEMVHIRQKHWFDLVLSSLLCAVQWFNPAAWIYSRFIRQNHEYLADEEALQRSSDPAVYRAVLLNQIAGSPVIDLGNFFSYSLNKKRFLMMKNTISSPWRKLRLLLILPVAALVLYAFAEPQYRMASDEQGLTPAITANAAMVKNVSGMVTDEKGNPLEGAAVVIKGSTVGTTTDVSGKFALKNVPDDAVLVISYVGFETKAVMVKAAGDYIRTVMKRGTMITDTVSVPPPPPPPPPAPSTGSAKVKVVPQAKSGDEEVFMVVEEMPEFPGGLEAMVQWIGQRVKYPEQAKKEGITGMVMVSFTVDKAGKVIDAKVERSAHPLLDAEAVRVIGEMPEWKPGSQRGKKVDVRMTVPVKFSLN
jgi:TonB family protein